MDSAYYWNKSGENEHLYCLVKSPSNNLATYLRGDTRHSKLTHWIFQMSSMQKDCKKTVTLYSFVS